MIQILKMLQQAILQQIISIALSNTTIATITVAISDTQSVALPK